MCFDKTGTLTEDGLDLYGVRAIGYSESIIKSKNDRKTEAQIWWLNNKYKWSKCPREVTWWF